MIAVVIKYADNILKNFSTAISIIVSSVYSWLFMGFQLSYLFVSLPTATTAVTAAAAAGAAAATTNANAATAITTDSRTQ